MLKEVNLFAFDLDGTIYVGDEILPGAVELIDYLRRDHDVVFFTNNSSKTRQDLHTKLKRLGIQCTLNEIYTSSFATAFYLAESEINDLYVVGSDGLCQELAALGLRVFNNVSAKNVVVGLDVDFNYKKITEALAVLQKGGKFIACNEDGCFPVEQGIFFPGCGAMVAAIAAAANKSPDFVVGKPNTYVLAKIAKDFHAKPDEIAVVGDSYDSDIEMAFQYQTHAVLINDEVRIKNNEVLVVKNCLELFKKLGGAQ